MKKWLIPILKITLIIAIFSILIKTASLDFSLLWNLLHYPFCLLFVLTFYFLAMITCAWRWYQLNEAQNIRVSFKKTLAATYIGVAGNNLLPGGIGGDFYRFYFLFKKIPARHSVIMLSILFDRLIGLLGIFATVCLIAFVNPSVLERVETRFYVMIAACLVVGMLGMLFIPTTLFPGKKIYNWILNRFAKNKRLEFVISLIDAISIYRNAKMTIFKCLAASIVNQLVIVATLVMIANILDFPSLPFFNYVTAFSITQIVILLPIAPGGFGIGEAAFGKVMLLISPLIKATFATIFLAYRILGLVFYLPCLAILYTLNRNEKMHESSVMPS